MSSRMTDNCQCGRRKSKKWTMCSRCQEKDGGNYTSSNFSLDGLSWEERAVVLLYAAGRTEWVDSLVQSHLERTSLRMHDDIYAGLKRIGYWSHRF